MPWPLKSCITHHVFDPTETKPKLKKIALFACGGFFFFSSASQQKSLLFGNETNINWLLFASGQTWGFIYIARNPIIIRHGLSFVVPFWKIKSSIEWCPQINNKKNPVPNMKIYTKTHCSYIFNSFTKSSWW